MVHVFFLQLHKFRNKILVSLITIIWQKKCSPGSLMLVDLEYLSELPPTFCRSGPRAGNSFVSSVFPRRPGSGALTRERIHAFHHRQSSSNSPGLPTTVVPGLRRFDSPRSLPAVVPAPPQHDQNGGFYILPPSSPGHTVHEAENPSPNHFHVWERERSYPSPSVSRDSNWGSFHQTTSGSDMGNGLGGFWHRHSS